MKNPITGRDTLSSRTSLKGGGIFLNRGMRDLYDASKSAEEFRKRGEELRRNSEPFRTRANEGRPATSALGIVVFAILVLCALALFASHFGR